MESETPAQVVNRQDASATPSLNSTTTTSVPLTSDADVAKYMEEGMKYLQFAFSVVSSERNQLAFLVESQKYEISRLKESSTKNSPESSYAGNNVNENKTEVPIRNSDSKAPGSGSGCDPDPSEMWANEKTELMIQLNDCNNLIRSLTEKVHEQDRKIMEMSTLIEALKDAQIRSNELKSKVSSLEHDMSRLQKEKEALSSALLTKDNTIDRLHLENSKMMETSQQIQNRNVELTAQVRKLMEQRFQSDERLRRLQQAFKQELDPDPDSTPAKDDPTPLQPQSASLRDGAHSSSNGNGNSDRIDYPVNYVDSPRPDFGDSRSEWINGHQNISPFKSPKKPLLATTQFLSSTDLINQVSASQRASSMRKIVNPKSLTNNTISDTSSSGSVSTSSLKRSLHTSIVSEELPKIRRTINVSPPGVDFLNGGASHQEQPLLEPSNESTLISEILESNYGFSDFGELSNCEMGMKFWNRNLDMIKYFIALHDDSPTWMKEPIDPVIVLKEQVGTEPPKTFHLTLKEIRSKLALAGNSKRIWLDVRDWALYYRDTLDLVVECGDFITHFSLGKRLYSDRLIRSTQVLNFIYRYLPNIEYLAVSDSTISNRDCVIETHDARALVKLKTVRFVTTKSTKFQIPFIFQLLKTAPNLTHLYGLPLKYLLEIERKIKIHGLKSVTFSCTRDYKTSTPIVFFKDLLTLADKAPGLEDLDVRLYYADSPDNRTLCKKIYTDLILSNQRTLKKLRIGALEKIGFLKFPRLENLEAIQFLVKPTGNPAFFPKGFDLDKTFSNVTEIEIMLEDFVDAKKSLDFIKRYFPLDIFSRGNSFRKVNHLKLTNIVPGEFLIQLSALFENITVLTVKSDLNNLYSVLPMIFSLWPKLLKLQLEIDLEPLINLDSTFLGISLDVCETLRNHKPNPGENLTEEVEKYRNQPSICNLRDLRLLKIVLWNAAPNWCPLQEETLFSEIVGLFGFNLMKNLRVEFGFHDRCSSSQKEKIFNILSPIRKYVTIDI